ncbi:MAG: 16S rRNA processing protein RimM [Chloroflexi bacterium]|nr:MAG: 16S rRNA processing protein RimM [Chloroflexota bacterium]
MPAEQPPFLLLGRVLRPHGIRGEIRIEVLTDYPERIVPGMTGYIDRDPKNARSEVEYTIESARTHQQYLILRLEDIPDRDAADMLREQFVMVAFDDAVPLDEDEFYLFQAIGLAVYTDAGEHLGDVADVLETGANDVYVVQGPRGEILLPAVDEVILDVDLDAGRMTVRLMAGLLGD